MLARLLCLFTCITALAACNSYTAPGAPADFSQLGLTPRAKAALTDNTVQQLLDKKPLVTFPASIAVARVQARDYDSYSYHAWRRPSEGNYMLMTIRDIETDEDFAALSHLPQVAGVGVVKRILVDDTLYSDLQLREGAARLHANLLLYYTLDTQFQTDTHVAPLGLITLGIFPNKEAKVTCTASAVLMDVNNGYIYSVVEATSAQNQLANAWNSAEAVDQVRRRTEQEAFKKLVSQFKSEWTTVVMTYNRRSPALGHEGLDH